MESVDTAGAETRASVGGRVGSWRQLTIKSTSSLPRAAAAGHEREAAVMSAWCSPPYHRRRVNLHKFGLAQSPSCDCGQRATDHEPHCRHVPINKIWRWTESTPRSGWRRSNTAGICSDCSTREKNESASLLHQDPSTSSSSYTPVYSVGVYCGSPRPFLMATYDDAVRSTVSNGYIMWKFLTCASASGL